VVAPAAFATRVILVTALEPCPIETRLRIELREQPRVPGLIWEQALSRCSSRYSCGAGCELNLLAAD